MKDSIKARLKTLFPDVNLSAKRINAIVAKLEADKVADDATAIDAALNSLNGGMQTFAEIAKSDDAQRTYDAKVKDLESKIPKDKKDKEDKKDEDDPDVKVPEDAPAYVKAIMAGLKATSDSNKALLEKVTKLEGDKTQATIKSKIKTLLQEEGKDVVPEWIWSKRALPTSEEELDDFVADVKNDFGTIEQKETEATIGSHPKPKSSSATTTVTKVDDKEVDKILDKIM